jgi:non-homologous end joining protein Ku
MIGKACSSYPNTVGVRSIVDALLLGIEENSPMLAHVFNKSCNDIRKFKDTHSAELVHLVKQKAKAKEPTVPKMKVTYRRTDDLTAQRKASLKIAS